MGYRKVDHETIRVINGNVWYKCRLERSINGVVV